MILFDIKRYLAEHKRASLSDLAVRFDTAPDNMRDMLQQWIRKGKVERMSHGGCCSGSCCFCDPLTTEIYEWIA